MSSVVTKATLVVPADTIVFPADTIVFPADTIVFPTEGRNLGRGEQRPTPDPSPLRLAQDDIFGEITGHPNWSIHHN